jgi:hypothetical protein
MREVFAPRYVVMKISRSPQGDISCGETVHGWAGMTWRVDGGFSLTTDTRAEFRGNRTPLRSLKEPEVAYSMAGRRLLDDGFPYERDLQGATVQISAQAVIEEPDHVALQLVLVPRNHEPYHRETVGDRRIDDGEPDIWIVLARFGDEPAERLAAARVLRWPPPLRAAARP